MTEDVLVLLDPTDSAAFSAVKGRHVRSSKQALETFRRCGRKAVWVAPRVSTLGLLASLVGQPGGEQRLLLLESAKAAPRHGLLRALFRYVLVPNEGFRLLPIEELVEVLGSANRDDLFIGIAVDPEDKAVLLYRGNLEPLIVPVSWFRARPNAKRPDFSNVAVIDHGQTVRLGTYEAATDAILYEFDAAYRRRTRVRRIEEDPSLGGSLRRLRLQKGLARSDFSGISAKEIARIERGEVKRPHPDTLTTVAKRLGVSPTELGSF